MFIYLCVQYKNNTRWGLAWVVKCTGARSGEYLYFTDGHSLSFGGRAMPVMSRAARTHVRTWAHDGVYCPLPARSSTRTDIYG